MVRNMKSNVHGFTEYKISSFLLSETGNYINIYFPTPVFFYSITHLDVLKLKKNVHIFFDRQNS